MENLLDLIVTYGNFNLQNINNLLCTSKEFNTFTDTNDIWTNQCSLMYSDVFWKKAMSLPTKLSNPVGSAKLELKRIILFEKSIYPEIWSEEDYFILWNSKLSKLES